MIWWNLEVYFFGEMGSKLASFFRWKFQAKVIHLNSHWIDKIRRRVLVIFTQENESENK